MGAIGQKLDNAASGGNDYMAVSFSWRSSLPRLLQALMLAGPVCFFIASISGCGEALPQPSATPAISAGPVVPGIERDQSTNKTLAAAEQTSSSIKPPSPPEKANTGERPNGSDKSSSEDDALL